MVIYIQSATYLYKNKVLLFLNQDCNLPTLEKYTNSSLKIGRGL